MDSEGKSDDLFTKKLAYPYRKFNLENMSQPLLLIIEDYWSKLTQPYPCDNDKKETQQLIDKYNITTPQLIFMSYSKLDVLQLTVVFENFFDSCNLIYGINPWYSYSAPGCTWRA